MLRSNGVGNFPKQEDFEFDKEVEKGSAVVLGEIKKWMFTSEPGQDVSPFSCFFPYRKSAIIKRSVLLQHVIQLVTVRRDPENLA